MFILSFFSFPLLLSRRGEGKWRPGGRAVGQVAARGQRKGIGAVARSAPAWKTKTYRAQIAAGGGGGAAILLSRSTRRSSAPSADVRAHGCGSRHARVWICEVCGHAPASVTCRAGALGCCRRALRHRHHGRRA